MEKQIEHAIKTTLVVENKQSIHHAVDKIMDIVKPKLKINEAELKKLSKPSMWDKVADLNQYSDIVEICFDNKPPIIITKSEIAETIGLDVRKDHIMDIIDSSDHAGDHVQQEIEVPINEWEFTDKQIEDYLTRKKLL